MKLWTGFKAALTRTINSYGRKSGILAANASGDALLAGLTVVIAVRTPSAYYNGDLSQLMTTEVKNIVNRVAGKGLTKFLKDSPQVVHAILDHTDKAAVQQ